MQRILGRRVFRDLKSNLLRYLALFMLMVMGMYMIVALVGAAETIICGVEQGWQENCLEDGQFSVFVPLQESEIAKLEEQGATIEKSFYMDYETMDSTLRVFQNREKINLFALAEGQMPQKEGQMLIEQHYAAAHDIQLGDTVYLGTEAFQVVGIGSTPDYDAVYASMADCSVEASQFGTSFVLKADYERLRELQESIKAEEYYYSYRLNGALTDDELKELLQSFELDRDKVQDKYFQEMIAEVEADKNDITEGIQELVDGCQELSDGLFEIAENNQDILDGVSELREAMLEEYNKELEDAGIAVVLTLQDYEAQLNSMIANPQKYSGSTKQDIQDMKESLEALQEFEDGVKEYTDGVNEISDGSGELCGGLSQLKENNDSLNGGAQMVFFSMLEQANEQLKAAGAPITLTAENYEEQLKALIATYGTVAPEMASVLEETLQSLQSLDAFADGVSSYTEGVAAATEGSQQLSWGLSVLYTASEPLKEGAGEIFDAMLEMMNTQLAESGLEVELTEANYVEKLDQLVVSGGQIDRELAESLKDGKETLMDLQEFQGGMEEYTDAVQEAADGSLELLDGVHELQDEADEMLEEYFTFDLDNLTAFIPRVDNTRVGASINDVLINKYAGLVAGVIVMILFTYVISVFVVHNIEEESTVIGALYALGVTRRQLLIHYLVLPVIVTIVGCVMGSILGFSSAGIETQMADAVSYFSMPVLEKQYPVYLMVYALVMPPVIAVLVNYIVISRKLKSTALALLRGETKSNSVKELNLGKMGYIRRFQIRQILRELRSSTAVIGGMFISLLILMMSVNCYVLCENYRVAAEEETTYEYLYSYKYPTDEVPEGGTEMYMQGLSKEVLGYNVEVSILGMNEGNPYFEVPVSTKKNELVISSAIASKIGVGVGESLVLSDKVNERDYAFTVTEIVPYTSGLYAFMDIDTLRELFDLEDDEYNVVFAQEALDIDAGRLYATTSRANIKQASEVFVNMMWPMIITMSSLSIIIFMVVMYLMEKVMIDRCAQSIALMKIMGYRKKEVKKLYLDGNLIIVALGAAICVPASKWMMDAMYPYLVSNVAIGMNLKFSAGLYAGIYGGIMLCYWIINRLLVVRLNKMEPALALKMRE